MTKYEWIFILNQQTLDSVSHSRPVTRTIVRKTYHILNYRELVPL